MTQQGMDTGSLNQLMMALRRDGDKILSVRNVPSPDMELIKRECGAEKVEFYNDTTDKAEKSFVDCHEPASFPIESGGTFLESVFLYRTCEHGDEVMWELCIKPMTKMGVWAHDGRCTTCCTEINPILIAAGLQVGSSFP